MNRVKSAIFISMILSGLATTVILPILAPLIRELHLTASQGGTMVSVGSIVMVFVASAWGAASDKMGRRPIMLAGFAGLFLSYAVYAWIVWMGLSNALSGIALFATLIAARSFVGCFLPAVPASSQALMADNTDEHERAAGMAIIGAASGIGLVVGPALSGLLAMKGLIWPLLLSTSLCLFAFFFVLILVPKDAAPLSKKAAPLNPFSKTLRPWLLTGVLTWFAIATVQISTGFYFQDRLGLTTQQTAPMLAIALTLVGAALFLTQLVLKQLKWPARRMVMTGLVIWVAAILILLFTASSITFFAAYAVMGIGAGMLMPGYMAGASLAVPREQQGAVAGFSAATQGIGFILGPITSTVLYEVNQTLPLWCLVASMSLLFLMFIVSMSPVRHPITESVI